MSVRLEEIEEARGRLVPAIGAGTWAATASTGPVKEWPSEEEPGAKHSHKSGLCSAITTEPGKNSSEKP